VAEGTDVTAAPGETITLTARATDPDGDELSFRWWRYFEADSVNDCWRPEALEDVAMAGLVLDRVAAVPAGIDTPPAQKAATDQQLTLTIPRDARPGETLHLICQVTDGGSPQLTSYARVIVTVGA
jgi:hypothetical protein